MNDSAHRLAGFAFILAVALALTPAMASAQNSAGKSADSSSTQASVSSKDRWLHIRVEDENSNEESVRVNVPLELAEMVLPTIDHDHLHNGRVKMGEIDCHGVDLRALLDAVRTSKDGEFVTVQDKESNVRVTKQNSYLLIHVIDNKRGDKNSHVDVKVPMKVLDALFSGPKDEIDLVAGLRALSAQDNTELVSITDRENQVRVWLDSKNSSD